ncbi:MAG: DUF465 domain-containing protein [Rickettsiales bacterium]|jgi:hypothetical protein|nr:DUF465 domain-containing protein [Rickettsiales bacterium]
MSVHAHIDSLAEKRSQIKEQIAKESARPAPDFRVITDLKKQNLALKEDMQRLLAALSDSPQEASS